eukprot:s1400_g2.t1
MVLHLSGLAIHRGSVDDEDTCQPLALREERANVDVRDFNFQNSQTLRPRSFEGTMMQDDLETPRFKIEGRIVLLQGSFDATVFGFEKQTIAFLPEGVRPWRTVRSLAPLLKRRPNQGGEQDIETELLADESLAVTIHTNGHIAVEGGNIHSLDKKGRMRVVPQKKRGWLYLDGVRFILAKGDPIAVSAALAEAKERKVSALFADDEEDAVSYRQGSIVGSIVCLEGILHWPTAKGTPHARRALGFLPKGHWPERREVFFTRGHTFEEEERCRVDIDCYGRVFCPEGGAEHGRVNLSGIIFKAADTMPATSPQSQDWDELSIQYGTAKQDADHGYKLLESFIQTCTKKEWAYIEHAISQQVTGRKLQTPWGQGIQPRGVQRINEHNLDEDMKSLWDKKIRKVVQEKLGIKNPHTLFQLSLPKLQWVCDLLREDKVGLKDKELANLKNMHEQLSEVWEISKHGDLHFKLLRDTAVEIVDQMVARIRHLYPERLRGEVAKKVNAMSNDDKVKYEEIYQFFRNFETNGNTMTHCSLMGTTDTFTATGKWFFPDTPSVQKQLFESIAWLYERNIFHYISERQTPVFPFIEDFDIEAADGYCEKDPKTGHSPPPDGDIIYRPGQNNGDPGELIRWRAMAIHHLFPQLAQLRCLVYSASGYNKGKERLKASFHLVWPDLIVEPSTAAHLREVTLELFHEESHKEGSFLQNLRKKLLGFYESNDWFNVFDKTTISATNGLRLPYNDKVSSVYRNPDDKIKVQNGEMAKGKAPKRRVQEGRYSKAVGELVFTFEADVATGCQDDKIVSAKWQNTDNRSIAQWIQMGSCRLDMSDPERTQPTQVCPTREGKRLLRKLKRNRESDGFDFNLELSSDEEGYALKTPHPNVRRCELPTLEFVKLFEEQLGGELDDLELDQEDGNKELAKMLRGSWISVTPNQAVWRGPASEQSKAKCLGWMPSWSLNRGKHVSAPSMSRPLELVYVRRFNNKDVGKIFVDGPTRRKQFILDILRGCDGAELSHSALDVTPLSKRGLAMGLKEDEDAQSKIVDSAQVVLVNVYSCLCSPEVLMPGACPAGGVTSDPVTSRMREPADSSSSQLKEQLKELKRNAEAQQQEMDKQKEQSSRLAKDLQAQLAAVSEGAKEKSKADDEPARSKDLPEAEKESGESSAELKKQLEASSGTKDVAEAEKVKQRFATKDVAEAEKVKQRFALILISGCRCIQDLQAQLASLAREKQKADEETSRTKDVAEAEKESGDSSAELKKQVEELKQTAEAQRQEIEKQKQESSRAKDLAEAEKVAKESAIEKMKKEAADLEKTRSDERAKVFQLNAGLVDRMTKDLEAARTEKEAVNQGKEAAEQRLAELTDRFASERAKLEDSMREEKKKAESAAENMQAQLKTTDAAATKSKEELEKAKSNLEDLQDKLQILQAERDELSKKLEGAIPKSSLPAGCKDVADLVRQRTASREEAAAERLAREQYQQALEKVEKAIQHRLPILVSQKQEIGRFKSRAALLTKQNEDLLARVKELEAKNSDYEARATKATESKKLVEDYARDAAHQLAVLLHENRKLTGSLPASEVTMEAREENRRAFRTVQELVDQNLSMRNSISQLLRESQEERKEMQLANDREKQLDKKLKDQEEKYTGLFEEQKAQIRKIEQERDQAQSEAKETTKQREAEAEARKVQIEAEQKTLSDERSKNEELRKARFAPT